MTARRERYPFAERDAKAGAASLAPLLPLRLRLGDREVGVSGLIDTGAAVSVVPWGVGVALGGNWGAAGVVTLSGNLVTVP